MKKTPHFRHPSNKLHGFPRQQIKRFIIHYTCISFFMIACLWSKPENVVVIRHSPSLRAEAIQFRFFVVHHRPEQSVVHYSRLCERTKQSSFIFHV